MENGTAHSVDINQPTASGLTKRGGWQRVPIWIISAVVTSAVLSFFAWAVGAVWFLHYLPAWLRQPLSLVVVAGAGLMFFRLPSYQAWRSVVAAGSLGIYLVTIPITPSNDRVWDPDQAKVAKIVVDDSGNVLIRNFRHAIYRDETDYDAHFRDVGFQLEQIQAVWMIVQRFTAGDGLAHLFVSFELDGDGRPPGPGQSLAEAWENGSASASPRFIALSVEIRRELGETYGPIKGLYRTYELTHVVGDERDLIGVRTIHRPNDRVYLFRLNANPQQAQQLFRNFAQRIERLEQSPEFYHTLLNNCTNGITRLTYELTPEPINWLDPRIVMPGYAGSFAYQQGLVGDSSRESFDVLEQRSRIDEIARQLGVRLSFSEDLRTQQ